MSVWTEAIITCDDPKHKSRKASCETIISDTIPQARKKAFSWGWTSNDKIGRSERWHCSESESPWCRTAPCTNSAEPGGDLCRKHL